MALGVPILKHFRVFKIPLQSDTMNDLIHFVGQCDLNFMVPLICQFSL